MLSLVASACTSGKVGSGGNTESSGDNGGSGNFDNGAPIICDAPMCDGDQGLYALSVSLPPLEMQALSKQDLRADIESRIMRRAPEMVLLAHWTLGTATGNNALDAALGAHPLRTDQAALLASVLDHEFGDWRDLASVSWADVEGPEVAPANAPAWDSAQQGLETSGCGQMRLQMSVSSVTVHERDDNLSGDRVYCVVRATDESGNMEVTQTDVSDPLEPGGTWHYEDGTFFGRGDPRDPGRSLEVDYDCWEMDDASEYERFEEILDTVMSLAKYLPASHFKAGLVAAGEVARVVIELGKIFDGSDYLFHASETFSRQDLWLLVSERPQRSVSARGNHNGSDWAWEFTVLADACAVGASGGFDGETGDGDGDDDDTDGDIEDSGEPEGCNGCRVGHSCMAGTDDDACGKGGANCSSCEGLESCQSGACKFNRSARVSVSALAAAVPGTDENGWDWDLDSSAPDVIMTVSVGGRSQATPLVRSYEPEWNTIVLTDVRVSDLMDSIEVYLIDDDATSDESIDGCYGAASREEIETGYLIWGCGRSEIALGFE